MGATKTRTNRSFDVLGVRVDAVQIPDVVDKMSRWIEGGGAKRSIAVTGMHGVTEAQSDPSFKSVLRSSDLVVPDGMPLIWIARSRGFPLERRVYGPELMATFCDVTRDRFGHFLYGGEPEVVAKLAGVLRERFGTRVVGTISPPFRPLTEDESRQVTGTINASRADVVWVGLSTPKQELWMHDHRHLLQVPVSVGVGAAFDLLAGVKKTAPSWMQDRGLEWLYRLSQEPRRLWRRYLIGGSKFVLWLALERAGLRDFGT